MRRHRRHRRARARGGVRLARRAGAARDRQGRAHALRRQSGKAGAAERRRGGRGSEGGSLSLERKAAP